jgi:hypothetical protein
MKEKSTDSISSINIKKVKEKYTQAHHSKTMDGTESGKRDERQTDRERKRERLC